MRTSLLLALLFAPAWAAGSLAAGVTIAADDGPLVLEDRGPEGVVVLARMPPSVTAAAPTDAALDDPLLFVKGFWRAVRAGDYFEAAALFAILLIAVVRIWGKRLHDWLADDSIFDRPLWFLLETKPGRVLMLALTTSAAGVGGAWATGTRIDLALVKPILAVTFAASTIYGWAKDFWEWWSERYPARAAQLLALFGRKPGAPS